MTGNILLFPFGGWEFLLVALVIVIFFGAKKIPELAKGIGRGIREFKDASKADAAAKKEVEKKDTKEIED